jgi:hypothetical protein
VIDIEGQRLSSSLERPIIEVIIRSLGAILLPPELMSPGPPQARGSFVSHERASMLTQGRYDMTIDVVTDVTLHVCALIQATGCYGSGDIRGLHYFGSSSSR